MKSAALIGLGAMGAYFAPRLYEEYGENFRVIAGGERKKRLMEQGESINGVNYHFSCCRSGTGRRARRSGDYRGKGLWPGSGGKGYQRLCW